LLCIQTQTTGLRHKNGAGAPKHIFNVHGFEVLKGTKTIR